MLENTLSSYPLTLVFNIVSGLIWIGLAGLLPEPMRQKTQVVIVAMAGGVYLIGSLGVWEVPLSLALLGFAYLGLTHYWGIGAAWLTHAGIDLLHHLNASPLVPTLPLSSVGCATLDMVLAIWFFCNAPALVPLSIGRFSVSHTLSDQP
ncbi:DUF6010 family protein [Leptolyngbya sp. CCNP1308]|uniref:DUF6010 family protein n=1 Tax=Leptolyngbya sp. CCNP1308 TaxID=3110255 RepID=UPI002B2119EC|nr:DUF6010 family protein [Leptolyngbya sp. CCNP1308]MEA5449069.1 DUF6010 family protein [Leptolyngbya sp. CCNP1308]